MLKICNTIILDLNDIVYAFAPGYDSEDDRAQLIMMREGTIWKLKLPKADYDAICEAIKTQHLRPPPSLPEAR
jgi:hypothetical protein